MSTIADKGPNAALIGRPDARARLMTPALVLDLDALEANLARFADVASGAGIAMRPHAKTHKCSEIARRQIAAGARGVCCATLREAEAMVTAGLPDVLITSPVVGTEKIARLAALNGRAERLAVVADAPINVAALAAANGDGTKPLHVLVDVDVGMHRTGVAGIGDAVRLARLIEAAPSLRFAGVQGYSGMVQHIEDYAQRRETYTAQTAHLAAVVAALRAAGLAPAVVTGGGTGTLDIDRGLGLFTEQQSGSYLFMDVQYNAVALTPNGPTPFRPALHVQCTVVSANADGFVTIDGGYKCFATDGPPPQVAEPALAGARYDRFGDEHGKLVLAAGTAAPEIGAAVRLLTPHCDPTVNLHDYYHCLRGDTLEDIWRIDARGVL